MKQNLQRISEWIELFLNYAVVFGIEIALNALIGDRVPVGVAGCSPVPCLLLSVP